jgi:hypothetical protein
MRLKKRMLSKALKMALKTGFSSHMLPISNLAQKKTHTLDRIEIKTRHSLLITPTPQKKASLPNKLTP